MMPAEAIIGLLVAVSLGVGFAVPLLYSQAALLFFFVAIICAQLVVRRVKNLNFAVGFLVGLAFFASFPMKKLYGVEEFVPGLLVSAGYCALLWIAGFGWRRKWS